MEMKSLGSVVKAAIIAGVVAALLVAIFHFIVTEPVIDRAIEIEEQLTQSGESGSYTPVVTRDMQRAGLFLGFLMYGLIWAVLFSVIYYLVHRGLPITATPGGDFWLALLAGWSVALLPFLKYPANPPGVGDPGTIEYRQVLYLSFIALSVAATVLAFVLHRHLGRTRSSISTPIKWIAVSAAYFAAATLLYFALPPNPDPINMPGDLVWTFRVLSWAGLAFFWAAFAAIFARLLKSHRTSPAYFR
ncbi:MAG: CbtA family protein [Chloroflexi bacterium]|nr:CbtA family protein [Chloroflexota bacterium]